MKADSLWAAHFILYNYFKIERERERERGVGWGGGGKGHYTVLFRETYIQQENRCHIISPTIVRESAASHGERKKEKKERKKKKLARPHINTTAKTRIVYGNYHLTCE